MSGFTYRLYLENGEEIGSFATAAPDWAIGDEFFNAEHTRLRIVNIVDSGAFGSDQYSALFVVTPTAVDEP